MSNTPKMRNKFSQPKEQKEVENTKGKHAEIEEHIATARLLAERACPSFISGLRASTVIISENIPTIGVDRYWRTYWNPQCVKFLIESAKAVSSASPCPTCGAAQHHQLSYLAGLWLHEVGHRVFKHAERMEQQGWTDHIKFNIAGDLELNDDIPGLGKMASEDAAKNSRMLPQLCLPSKCLIYPEEYVLFCVLGPQLFTKETGKSFWDITFPFDAASKDKKLKAIPFGAFPNAAPTGPLAWTKLDEGKIAEVYYELLPVEVPQEQEGKDGQGEGKDKAEGKDGRSPGSDALNDHGSGAGGESRHWEDGDPGEAGNAPGISPQEQHAIRRNIAAKIKETSNNRGLLPAGWEVWADTELQTAKVRWQDKLKALARQAINRIRGDRLTTFRRPSRYSIVQDFSVMKPSTYEITPVVYVVVDTSGSMGAGKRSRLERALSEAEAIVKCNKVKAYFLDCDANVYGKAQEVHSVRSAKVHGGGGTDMRVGVLAALSSKPKADFIVLITDGETPWPADNEIRGCKVLTAIANDNIPPGTPPYMNPILVEID